MSIIIAAHSNGTLLFPFFPSISRFKENRSTKPWSWKHVEDDQDSLYCFFFFMFFRKINSIAGVTASCCCISPPCSSLKELTHSLSVPSSLMLFRFVEQLIKLHTADFALFGLSLRLIADYMICMYVCDFEGLFNASICFYPVHVSSMRGVSLLNS